MAGEFAHTILHKQHIFNKPAPAINQNKPDQQDDKAYYKNLRNDVKNMVIPKREVKAELPKKVQEPVYKVSPAKEIPQRKPELIPRKPAPQKYSPKPQPSPQKPPSNPRQPQIKNQGKPISRGNQEVNQKASPSPEEIKRPASNYAGGRNQPENKPKPPKPNFYVHDYKPYKYEEPVAMIIPVDMKVERKPQSQANQRKKLEELKEKAKKDEQKKEELLREQKKREEERSDRMRKLKEERLNMKRDIENKRRCGNKFNDKGFGLIQFPEIKETDSLNIPPKITEAPQVEQPKESPKALEEAQKVEAKEEVKEFGRETAKFAQPPVNPPIEHPPVDASIKSKSIRMQVDLLTKSIIERQKAKLKEEEQLEKDALDLAVVCKDVSLIPQCSFWIIRMRRIRQKKYQRQK